MIKSSKKKKNKIENSSSSRQNTSPFSQDHTTPKFHITNSPKNYYFNGVPRI